MPVTKRENELKEIYLLDDDSSDEEDESGDDSSDESGSNSNSDSDSDSESGSDSDDSDSDSDDESDSDSDSESGSSKALKKKKKKAGDSEEKKDEESPQNAIYKIRQISNKLSWLLDDLHKTFKPKSVPKIDPKDVFPYPYIQISQFSPQSKHYTYNTNVVIESSNKLPIPISSPVRHGNNIDRGTGGNYIFPAYAEPPSKTEIKTLYRNYSDKEREQIAENQRKESRKLLFPRTQKSKSDSYLWTKDANARDFSDQFISASNERRNSRFKNLFGSKKDSDNIEDNAMPHTFDELYKHYDTQKRLIEQKQQKMNRIKNRLYWFKKNNSSNDTNVRFSEKKPLMTGQNNNAMSECSDIKKERLFPSQSLKETENNLLNKAAQILLGNGSGNDKKPSTKGYDSVCPDSPDSLQQKIAHITSDDEEVNRMPTFV